MVCRDDIASVKHTLFIVEVTLNSIIKLLTEIEILSKRYKRFQCWELYVYIVALPLIQHYDNIL
jgi:hypothetical protein